MAQENNAFQIPFSKSVRVGNFKLWRSKISLSYTPSDEEREKVRRDSNSKERAVTRKFSVDAVNVSTLDGSWKVQIPSTLSMFSTICNGYATTDDNLREHFLGMIFTNIYNCSTVPSEALHDAFFFLTEMLTFPYLLLSEKEMRERMDKTMKELGSDRKHRKEHIDKMCAYRRELYELIKKKKARLLEDYERQQAERRAQESESLKKLEEDDMAEQAVDILNEPEVE